MSDRTRLITDATGKHKLLVSLPGGRYQLSLDDSAAVFLTDDCGYAVRDTVPDEFVPVFLALGDAWFPNERDVERVIDDFAPNRSLTESERGAIRSYVTSSYIREFCVDRVLDALDDVGVSDVEQGDLDVNSIDVDVESIFGGGETSAAMGSKREESAASPAGAESSETADPQSASNPPEPDRGESVPFGELPGIGPTRAEKLREAGVPSLEALADLRPIDLGETAGLSEDLATVAIEGAREVTGRTQSTSESLATETGVDEGTFAAALNSLAAAGVPGSRAAPTLRVLFGPTVADVDAVTGAQAYHLWEAGYRTPKDLVDASNSELSDVYDIGEATAPEIRAAAAALIE